jgi:ABC-type sugar transport system substrate-binding protein
MDKYGLNRRRVPRLLATGVLATVALTGCSSTASTTAPQDPTPATSAAAPASAAGGLVYAHSYQNLSNEFFASELKAEQKKAAENGIEVKYAQADDNPATQLDDINNLLSLNPDVMVIDAIDPNAVVPGIQAANERGIPVIMLIREPAGGQYESLLYLDSVKDGFNACTAIAEKLGGKGNVVNLGGPLEIAAAKERWEGCDQAFANYPDINVVARPATDYTVVDAERVMTDVLTANPDVDGVFGGNDSVALGAMQAIIAAGQDPKEKAIMGVDGILSALQAVCDGKMTTTYATFPNTEADFVYDLVTKVAAGQPVEKKVLFAAIPIGPNEVVQAAMDVYGETLTNCVK